MRFSFIILILFVVASVFAEGSYTSLEEALKNPTEVKSLNLCGKGLVTLPESIGKLVNLQRLNISSNNLTSLPKVLFTITKLNYLNVTSNKLKAIPSSISNLKTYKNLKSDLIKLQHCLKKSVRLQNSHVLLPLKIC